MVTRQRRPLRRIQLVLIISGLLMFHILSNHTYQARGPLSSSAARTTKEGKCPLYISSISIQHNTNNFKNPIQLKQNNDNGAVRVELPPPMFGEHRKESDAVFAFAYGYKPDRVLPFVQSLISTGYDGDIVLGIDYNGLIKLLQDNQDFEARAFARYIEHTSRNSHLVVHDVKLHCDKDRQNDDVCTSSHMFQTTTGSRNSSDNTTTTFLRDPRIARHVSQLRNEYYWAWSYFYLDSNGSSRSSSRILLSDLRDVYFQGNPFLFKTQHQRSSLAASPRQGTTLQVFMEDATVFDVATSLPNSIWVREARGKGTLDEIGRNSIVCSGTVFGGATAIESYLRAMIEEFDDTQCTIRGCDQGLHNIVLYSGKLFKRDGVQSPPVKITNYTDPNDSSMLAAKIVDLKPDSVNNLRIESIEYIHQGYGAVNTLRLLCMFRKPREGLLKHWNILKDDKDKVAPLVLNWDGRVTPVIHQYDSCPEISRQLTRYGNELWEKVSLSFR